ncbi:MAG: hypothetical protein GY845_13785 [Planctomycetes bacterium]|nr:hypothetical protein [Planctomycetota bacterium]
MNKNQCTNCLQLFEDDRPPPDESLPGIPHPLCPNCWANKLAWDDDPDAIAKRNYSLEEQTLVTEWSDKWNRLSHLLIKIFSSADPPTDTDEITYMSLRSWFLDHQDAFMRVFADLYEAAVVSAVSVDGDDCPDTEEVVGVEGYSWNPFQWYYREPDVYRMAEDNRLLASPDPWEPDTGEVGSMKFDFAVIEAMMTKLREWVQG